MLETKQLNSACSLSAFTMEEHGFKLLKGTIPESTLVNLRALTDDIIAYADAGYDDPFAAYYMRHRNDNGALYDLYQRHPEFDELARNKTVLDSIAETLGEDIFIYENSLVYKPHGKQNAVPWHQDFINRPEEPKKIIAWFALDDVRIANGAMQVIPKSHKKGFLPWFTVAGETHHTRLKPEFIPTPELAVSAEMCAGDVLIFDQLLVHGSQEVHSELPRRAFRVSYQGFDEIYTPRAVPIVVRGGSPSALRRRVLGGKPSKGKSLGVVAGGSHKAPKHFLRRAVNRFGRFLTKV